jgi:hypothetical protein
MEDEAFLFFILIIFFVVLGFDLKASCLLGRYSTTWDTLPALFVLDIFEVGSRDLFAQAGFKSWIVLLISAFWVVGIIVLSH